MEEPTPVSEFKSKSGLVRIYKAFTYSLQGIKAAWDNEHAFRQEMALVVVGVVVALFLRVAPYEKLALICVLILILIVELINSAVEAIVDRVSLERHPLSKNAKDLGSAAVFFALLIAGMTWGVVLWHNFA
jgi:diacylglycerol kinase (ATP)